MSDRPVVEQPTDGHLTVIPFIIRGSLEHALSEARYDVDVSLVAHGEQNAVLGTASRTLRSGRCVEAHFRAWTDDGITALLSARVHEDALEHALRYLLRRCYPEVTVPALSETDLARIILRVAENQRWDIVNRYSVAYPEGRRGARIERRPMPFGELLQELSDHRRVLESISFDCVSTRGDTLMTVYLSRCGVTKLYAGDFDQFLELFIAPINQQHKDRYAVMDGRSRSHELPAGRPISIEFSAPVLDDRGQLEKLCAVLATIDDSAVCVFHMNPQLHVALVDYADASTMDVCMIGPSKLKIIPGYRTSGASLLRVCDVITGQYAEGAVVA